jgi:hypothetical protein
MNRTAHTVALAVLLTSAGGAFAQQAQNTPPGSGGDPTPPRATSASDLLNLMRQQGYEVDGDLQSRADGSVVVPAKADADAFDPENIWDNRFELSLTFTDGNTESTVFRTAVDSVREVPTSKLTLDASYLYAQASGTTANNEATAGANHDWLLEDSNWIPFATARWDWNQFQSWDHRLQAQGGAGYRSYKSDNQELILRGGAGLTREFGSSRNEIIPEGLLGFDYFVDIAENQSGELIFRYFPSLANFTEFRLTANAGYVLDLPEVLEGLSFSAGVEFEHQSEVDPGIERNEVLFYAGIGLDF